MKIWQKTHTATSARIEQFTVGRDREFDLRLARYDVLGSLAHTAMLCKTGLLQEEEYALIEKELQHLLSEIDAGTFIIDEAAEDIHSQIEYLLTRRIGEAGKKIHSGRSRNDQVAVDIKLYLRDAIRGTAQEVQRLFDCLITLSDQYRDVLLPGYTHLQVAMPSSFGLWFGAYAESLADDAELLAAAYAMTNKNPLGSGAGYGSSFPLDRQMTTELLGFASLHYNSVYAQMSRGKTERFVSVALGALAATLARLSMDVCLYMSQNFGFLSFPDELTTGSSIMPHKKNPDVFELIRARCNRIQAIPNELALLTGNLPSGYHRDLQLTKEILFPAIDSLNECLSMAVLMLESVQVKEHLLNDKRYRYIFSVEKVNALVHAGVPFRDAYRQVGDEIAAGAFQYDVADLHHTHEGSIGNLCNEEIRKMMAGTMEKMINVE